MCLIVEIIKARRLYHFGGGHFLTDEVMPTKNPVFPGEKTSVPVNGMAPIPP